MIFRHFHFQCMTQVDLANKSVAKRVFRKMADFLHWLKQKGEMNVK